MLADPLDLVCASLDQQVSVKLRGNRELLGKLDVGSFPFIS